MPALFAQALSSVDAELGACLAVTYWPGGDEEMERAGMEAADCVVVYGGADSVAAVRARTPGHVRFVGYGPKLSFGMVGRGALTPDTARETARLAALDASTFDQQGCVSPHLFYVEEGGAVSPRDWAALLADGMAAVEAELPRGTLAPRESAAIRQLRGEAEFAEAARSGTVLHASAEGTAWTVIYEADEAFAASCLNRVVRVKPVARLEDVPERVSHLSPLLQTVGLELGGESRPGLAAALAQAGATRICALGEMAWPPPTWHHDGQPPLGVLVRRCDVEG